MKKLVIILSVPIFFCIIMFLTSYAVIAGNEIDEKDYFSNESAAQQELFSLLPGTRRNIVVLGAFATTDEPQLSTEVDSNCSMNSSIKQRYKFSTEEKVFFGLAIKNSTTSSENLNVIFLVTGPIILREAVDITIPAESICLPFTNIPVGIPEGLYKISGFVPGRGRSDLIIDFGDDVTIPTPIPTPSQ